MQILNSGGGLHHHYTSLYIVNERNDVMPNDSWEL